ncbi:hypothetical protein Fmac_025485 [Flemingia macrophylla]|uniref:Uncharacterized protein n=1 Tax=Flemingia macrophylla TaxID=520843 RepID=A0ABD1LSC5_9FABA
METKFETVANAVRRSIKYSISLNTVEALVVANGESPQKEVYNSIYGQNNLDVVPSPNYFNPPRVLRFSSGHSYCVMTTLWNKGPLTLLRFTESMSQEAKVTEVTATRARELMGTKREEEAVGEGENTSSKGKRRERRRIWNR